MYILLSVVLKEVLNNETELVKSVYTPGQRGRTLNGRDDNSPPITDNLTRP